MSSIVVAGDTSGSVSLSAPAVAGTTTQTLPLVTGNVLNDAKCGVCKAWVNFNGVTTATIRASYNIASVTRTAAGTYTIVMTNALVDANYVINVSCGNNNGATFHLPVVNVGVTITSTTFGIQIVNSTFATQDEQNIFISVFR